MSLPTWKTIINFDGSISYWRKFSDGRQESLPPDHPDFLAWLAEGNEPLPAPEPEPAPVLTTEQKLEAAGLTVAELKELFGLQ